MTGEAGVATATIGAPAQGDGVGRIVLASLIGTAIEFYDFYIYGTAAALVIGQTFFPQSAPQTQALNAFLTFGIAFLARPGRRVPVRPFRRPRSAARRRWSRRCWSWACRRH